MSPVSQESSTTSKLPRSDKTPAQPTSNSTYRPFDRVPFELLSHILTLTWLSYKGNDSVDRFRFPSLACKVDRYFHHTAISTPILWSYLRITSNTKPYHINDRVQHPCGNLPLDVCFMFKDVSYEKARSMLEMMIVSNLRRFGTIALVYPELCILDIPYGHDFWDHLDPLNGHPIDVVNFFIDCLRDCDPMTSLPLFSPSTLLVDIRCIQFNWPIDSVPQSLKSLSIREYNGDPDSAETMISFLSGSLSQSLRRLSLANLWIGSVGGHQAGTCTLESLESLELEMFPLGSVVELLGSILTPNLRHLSLKIIYHNISAEMERAWSAFRFPFLQKLTLERFDDSPHRLVELITTLPDAVRYLEINGPCIALLDPATSTFCGQLHHIVSYQVPLGFLVSLAEGRCTSLRGLEARYRTVSQACEGLKTKSELEKCIGVLKSLAKEVDILLDGAFPGTEEASFLAFEQLVEVYKDGPRVDHPS